jgi:hypothetical protein
MHLKATHLVRAASFFPNSISRPYNYLSPVSFLAALAPLPPSLLPLRTIVSDPRTKDLHGDEQHDEREMQISAEISRGIPAWKLLFLFLPRSIMPMMAAT